MVPVILAGVGNMVYMRLPWHAFLMRPMDGGLVLPDGRCVFGENKTWKGFFGMIVLCALAMGAVKLLHLAWPPLDRFSLIPYYAYRPGWVVLGYGALWGLGYVLFELPNSFMKRRLNIAPGSNTAGGPKLLFTCIDQADSALGCTLFMYLFYQPPWWVGACIFLAGSLVHYLVNVLLYFAGLRNQAG
jgi:CDP-diglyceride synthetase